MAVNYRVKIENNHGVLEDSLTAAAVGNQLSVPDLKKRKEKRLKKEYRDHMKDATKYIKSHMADSDHLTLVMRRNQGDDVVFVYAEPFIVYFLRDPDVDDDPSAPDEPFEDANGTAVLVAVAQPNANNPVDERYEAGPFLVKQHAVNQKFYKFSIQTLSGLTLDPCIITE